MDLQSADLVQLSLAFRRVKASEGDVSDDDNNEVNITMFTFFALPHTSDSVQAQMQNLIAP